MGKRHLQLRFAVVLLIFAGWCSCGDADDVIPSFSSASPPDALGGGPECTAASAFDPSAGQVATTCRLTLVYTDEDTVRFDMQCSPPVGENRVAVRLGWSLYKLFSSTEDPTPESGVSWGLRSSDVDDWGIDILDVSNLVLEDVFISGFPLSSEGPLLQCLNCTNVTARNVTLLGGSAATTASASPPAPASSNAKVYGAVRFAGVGNALLETVICSGMRGAYSWSCILVEAVQPGATIVIRNSSFTNNSVDVGDWKVPPASDAPPADQTASPPAPPYGSTLTFETAARRADGLAPKHFPSCLQPDSSPPPVPVGFGAVVVSSNASFEYTTVVYVESTAFIGNKGGCGTGFALVSPKKTQDLSASLALILASSTFADNQAEMDGGGLAIQGFTASFVTLQLVCGTSISSNSAQRHGGAVAVAGSALDIVVRNSSLVSNMAIENGGAICVHSMTGGTNLTIHSSGLHGNGAGAAGGAVFVKCYDGNSSFQLQGGSRVSNNSAESDNGGAICLSSQAVALLLVDSNSTVSDNSAYRHGGALYVEAMVDVTQAYVGSGTKLLNNRAGGNGGALYISASRSVNDIILYGGSELRGNTAGSNGGAVFIESVGDKVTAVSMNRSVILTDNVAMSANGGGLFVSAKTGMGNFTFSGGSLLGNNTAGDHGGGAFISVTDGDILSVSVLGSSSVSGNRAINGSGGGIHVTAGGIVAAVDMDNGVRLSNNNAIQQDGGAIFLSASAVGLLSVTGSSIVSGNSAGRNGGGFCVSSTVSNTSIYVDGGCQLFGNKAAGNGSGLYVAAVETVPQFTISGGSLLTNNTAGLYGGGAFVSAGRDVIDTAIRDRSSVSGNTASDGGGMYISARGIVSKLTITGNSVVAGNAGNFHGGGLYLTSDVSFGTSGLPIRVLVANGSTAAGNIAGYGGFLYAWLGTSAQIQLDMVNNTSVSGNNASEVGGGVCIYCGNATVTIRDHSVFEFNRAGASGGAIALYATDVIPVLAVTGASVIKQNYAGDSGGGVYAIVSGNYGGIDRLAVDGQSVIANNTAKKSGGGIYAQATGNIRSLNITNSSRFEGNAAMEESGGGMFAQASGNISVLLLDGSSAFVENTAAINGGAISASALLVNVCITGSACNANSAPYGGCLYMAVTHVGAAGTALVSGASALVGNSASHGGAMYINGFISVYMSGHISVLSNNATWSGAVAAFTRLPPDLRVDSCLIANNTATQGPGGVFSIATAVNPGSTCGSCALELSTSILLSDSKLAGNRARGDGGVFHILPDETCCKSELTISITGSELIDNHADGAGGVLALVDAALPVTVGVTVNNSTVSGNSAGSIVGDITSNANYGGAFFIWYQQEDHTANPLACRFAANGSKFDSNTCNGGSGGAIMLISCSTTIYDCAFNGNQATLSGGAVALLHAARRSWALRLSAPSPAVSTAVVVSAHRRRRVLLAQATLADTKPSHVASAASLKRRQAALARQSVSHERSVFGFTTPRRGLTSTSRRLSEDVDGVDPVCVPSWRVDVGDSSFTNNAAQLEYGGAIYIDALSYSNVSINGSVLQGNSASQQHGGAIFLSSEGPCSSAAVTSLSVTESTAAANAGALYFLLGADGVGIISNVNLTSNKAVSSGGACLMDVRNGGSLRIESVHAGGNTVTGGDGGALQFLVQREGRVSVSDCTFVANKASSNGGALHLDSVTCAYIAVVNSSFARCTAGDSGGAIYASFSSITDQGGANSSQLESASVQCPDREAAQLSGLVIYGGSAGNMGGAVFVAPSSTVSMVNLTMDNNMAVQAGGSVAAQNCSLLAMSGSSINGSRADSLGGGVYVEACARFLLETSSVTSNAAGTAGGGVAIAGAPFGSSQRGASGNSNYTSAIISGTRLSGNMVTTSAQDRKSGICRSANNSEVTCRDRNDYSYGQGGGLYINGSVAAAVSRSNFAGGNGASFGAALATRQQCYDTVNASNNSATLTNNTSTVDDPWVVVWNALDRAAGQQCWILQISDTLLPAMPVNGSSSPTQKALTLWTEDILASPLFLRCASNLSSLVPSGTAVAKVKSYSDSAVSVAERLNSSMTSRISTDMASLGGSSDSKSPVARRYASLLKNLQSCMDGPAASSTDSKTAMLQQPYLGVPPTYMGMGPTQASLRQQHTGASFDVSVQLYDIFGQPVTLDVEPAYVTLALLPLAPTVKGGFPWETSNIATLDPGLNKTLDVPVTNGIANWSRVVARGWPSNYSLTVTLTPVASYILQVAQLTTPLELLPCSVGETLDLSFAKVYNHPSWTGCTACVANHYSLWIDNRMTLTSINRTDYEEYMNTTDYQIADELATCLACPQNAYCPGGAVIVPHPGYWHSAPNSTLIHDCPNPKACCQDTTPGKEVAYTYTDPGVISAASDVTNVRSLALIKCQQGWYSSVPPGNDVTAAYELYTEGLIGADSTNSFCLLSGLPVGDPSSYMQQLCDTGYTGNLCAACIRGYYADSNFNCKQCPSVANTVGLGILSFFCSVVVVLFTTMTNFSEGFGEQAGQIEGQNNPHNRVELGDVVKVIVLHVQYLVIVTRLSVDYPGVIQRCQAVFSVITGAENYIVYSPSCLLPNQDSAGQGHLQLLAGIITPCIITLVSMLLWALRYTYKLRWSAGRALVRNASATRKALLGLPRFMAAWADRQGRTSLPEANGVEASPGSGTVTSPAEIPEKLQPGTMPSDFQSGSGMRSPFLDVQIVAFENENGAADAIIGDDDCGQGLARKSPPLPTAASTVAVVDFDDMDLGTAARAQEPSTPGTVQGEDRVGFNLRYCDMTTVPEEALDCVSVAGGTAESQSAITGQARPDLAPMHSIAITAGSGGILLPSVFSGSAPYPFPHPAYKKTLSHVGSMALNDAMKTIGKIKTLAVSKQETLKNVDKALTLWEQRGIVLMAAVFILYPSWAHAALSTFACYVIDDGTGPFAEAQQATWSYGYWVRDMQAQCYSGTHLRVYVPIGVVSVVVFCLLPPLASFWFVWRIRGRLHEMHVRKVYGFLYKRYKESFIWWETALQLETLALVTVEVLGRGLDVSYQALLLLSVFTVIAVINVTCAPLVSHLLLIMEFMSLATLSLTITLSLYFTVNESLHPTAENVLAVIIIALNTCLMVFFLYVASRHLWPGLLRKLNPVEAAPSTAPPSTEGDRTETPRRGRLSFKLKRRKSLFGTHVQNGLRLDNVPSMIHAGSTGLAVEPFRVSRRVSSLSLIDGASDAQRADADSGCNGDHLSSCSIDPVSDDYKAPGPNYGHVYIQLE